MHLNFPIVSDDIHISTIIQTSEHWSLILLRFFRPSVEKLPKLSYQQATANKHNIGIIMSLNFLIVHKLHKHTHKTQNFCLFNKDTLGYMSVVFNFSVYSYFRIVIDETWKNTKNI